MIRVFFEITLVVIVFWQFCRIQRFKSEMNHLCDELDSLLDGQKGFLLFRTNNEQVQRLTVSVNVFLERVYKKNAEFKIIKKELREMMVDLSHDLKTPLTTLSGYVQLLQLRLKEDPENIKSVEQILKKLKIKTEQTNRGIMQFLDIAKIQSGDMEISKHQIDINRLCKEVLMEYYDVLELNGIYVNVQIEDKASMIISDYNAICCILRNLIDNALKYGMDGKYLGLAVKESDDTISIEVTDHGQGIEKDEQEFIFERNYRAKAVRQKNNNGSGLGLSICSKLAEQLNAKLRVNSIPHEKTIFKLLLEKS
ncbi:HAMP domain-containing sensor histidine kinase [Eubacterium sp.]|uniref:sensor histidine kinase n=1 Tax=Eubacterium sp. TaxID=142586 RepID=UPI0025D88FD4|nr:HAMP domain-containing sensor histidine kinase [Eubacterium sp.]MCR5629574.1 HAMP domain-containing histidine kinase [Eubacterium sp.]